MKEKDYRFPVALVKKLWPVCGKEADSEILMSMRGTKVPDGTHAVEKLHNQATGFADHFCQECKDAIGDNVYIVVVDEDKTDDQKNPYRAGNIFGLRKEAIERMFGDKPEFLADVLKKQLVFMDYRPAIQMGLPVEYKH